MKKALWGKSVGLIIIALFFGITFVPAIGIMTILSVQDENGEIEKKLEATTVEKTKYNDDTEYWALLVGCNEFMNAPWMDLPHVSKEIEELYNLLLISDHWRPDHIKVLTGKNVSSLDIFKGLLWLGKSEDENDMCFIYVSTHGNPILDLPPKDEDDQMDEALATYSTWKIKKDDKFVVIPWIHTLFDDEIDLLLRRLESENLCVLFHTCYSGGFAEIGHPGSIIVTSCGENEETKPPAFFYYFLEGLQGYCDINKDGLCSIEEAFAYADPKTKAYLKKEYNTRNTPTITDKHDGELILTQTELPPTPPQTLSGPLTGKINQEYTYSISLQDPENDKIRCTIELGDEKSDTSEYFPSGESTSFIHSWENTGTYNVYINSEDEHGARIYEIDPPTRITISIAENNELDQQHTQIFGKDNFPYGAFKETIWLAQSFIPTMETLSIIDLEIVENEKHTVPVEVSIWENLTGEDLSQVSLVLWDIIPDQVNPRSKWTSFDIPDITVTPDETYYILCKSTSISPYGWLYNGVEYPESYSQGKAFISQNQGQEWSELSYVHDFCFVTYT